MAEPRLISSAPSPRELNTFTKKALIVAAIVIVLALLWSVRRILIVVFIAGVLAAGIAPAVRRVQIWGRLYLRRKISRGVAVLLVYLPFLLVGVTILALTLPHLIAESEQLTKTLPKLFDERVLEPLESVIPPQELQRIIAGVKQHARIEVYVRSVAMIATSIVAVAFLVIYMLIDAERLRNLFLLIFPAEKRASKRRLIRRVSRRMSMWLSGQLLLGAIVGGATLVGLLLLRVPYALPLALIAAVGEMIPIIGPIVGAIPAVIVAALMSKWQMWAVVIMAIVIQQLENYLLVPRVMGKKVSISPLAVFIAFMMGATLLGIIGAIMAIPAAAIVQVIFQESFIVHRERRRNTDRPGTLAKTGV